MYNGHAYHLTKAHLTWDEHESEANRWGGHLVSIVDQRELDFILDNIINASDPSAWSFFVGIASITQMKTTKQFIISQEQIQH